MKTTSKLRFISFAKSRAVLLALSFCAASVPAAQLIWDPLLNSGTSSGSSNWDTTAGNAIWWNGASDVVWSQTATNNPLNGAIFNGPDAAPGTYSVIIDSNQVAVSNLQINANGYTFSGANAIYVNSSDTLSVAAGKTVTFNCNMSGSGTSPFWQLGSGSTMNVGGNLTSGQQLRVAGPANSLVNLTGVNNTPGIFFILAPVTMTAGNLTAGNNFFIGYTDPATINGTAYTAGSFTITNAALTENSGIFIIARAFGTTGGQGVFTIQNGSTVNIGTTKAENLDICYDGTVADSAIVNMQGGVMTVGASGFQASQIAMFAAQQASAAGATAVLNQTGGTINAWGGIVLGLEGGAGSATLTNSGGFLYLGPSGITKGASLTGPFSVVLSGGTVGALANWSSSAPMTLGTANGNITFQCADGSGDPFTITLTGPLTGAGGMYVTGGGTLALSGPNNYAGTTIVSNGTLSITTGSVPITNGPVTLDGSAGSPVVSVTVTSAGQYWTNNGSFTFQNGTTAASFQFGPLAPSTAVAPVQVTGDVDFAATPNVIVGGSSIATGTYPLIKYTGATNGAMPASVTVNLSGGTASGYLTNISAAKTISLVVTSSTFNPAVSWAVGNGTWDINTTANWKQSSSPAKYVDGDAVLFDDSAAGPSPIAVTLNIPVNPLNVTFNNASPTNYAINGTGSIGGSGSVSVLGSGNVTLATTNTFSGGTTVSAGQLNINNGGTSSATAIGTGTLTLNSGASLDNTSGSDVTLQASIPETWNGNFTYVGVSNNFNTGTGPVTMSNSVSLAVNSQNFTVGGIITDNAQLLKLTKTGNGTLTLPAANNFFGGVTLSGGQLNLGSAQSVGFGVFTIGGGTTIDNISGGEFTLTPASHVWDGSFTFLGSTNLDLGGGVSIPNGLGSITLDIVANTLVTIGDVANNNTEVIKTGNGTWAITGTSGGAQSLGLVVNAGEVILNKTGGQAVTGGNNVGLTVQSNALVIDENNFQIHSDSPVLFPVVLSGGIWDLNGFNENVDEIAMSAGGTLRNGATNATSLLTLISGHPITLGDTNCHFNVETTTGILTVKGVITGGGALLKDGLGILNLESNQTYSGSTTVNNGTIALPGFSSLSNTIAIILATNTSAVDVSSNTDINSNSTPVLVLLSGQTLSGFGTVTGLVQTASGSVLAPGSASTIGTLTVTGVAGTNTLGGTTMMKLDKGNHTNDQLSVSGSLAYGGTLSLTNLSGTLSNGDSFVLFPAGGYSGAFAGITPATPGAGLAWNTTSLGVNGTLAVMTGSAPSSPRITSVSLSGNTLMLSGTNGPAGQQYMVLESTNVAAALSSWTPVYTNSFDGSGNFNVSFSVTNTAHAFFAITTP